MQTDSWEHYKAMAVRYSRLPSEDVELGQSAFDFKSAFTYGQSFPSADKYKSIFNYNKNKSMHGDGVELSVGKVHFFTFKILVK